jgi:hypothetical protein
MGKKDCTVRITEYFWGGRNFFYTIKSHCEDCDIIKARIEGMLKKELKDFDIQFEFKPWLDNFFYCLFRRTWHAPIIMVNGKKFWQYTEEHPLFDKEKLLARVKDVCGLE